MSLPALSPEAAVEPGCLKPSQVWSVDEFRGEGGEADSYLTRVKYFSLFVLDCLGTIYLSFALEKQAYSYWSTSSH